MARPKKEQGMTLGEICNLTHRKHWQGTPGEKTALINAKTVLDYFQRDCPITEIDVAACDEFVYHLRDKGKADATINRKLSALSKMLSYAKEYNYIETTPKLNFKKEGDHRIRFVSDEEEKQLFSLLRHWGMETHADYYAFCLETGGREMEVLKMTVRDYQPVTKTITFWGKEKGAKKQSTKSGNSRGVPLTDKAVNVIEKYIKNKRPTDVIFSDLNKYQVITVWRKVRRAMGLENDEQFVIHALRHTCASRLAMEGVPIPVIQAWLGHATIATTMRYVNLSPKALELGREVLNKRRSDIAEGHVPFA